jgi:hypothetical protein
MREVNLTERGVEDHSMGDDKCSPANPHQGVTSISELQEAARKKRVREHRLKGMKGGQRMSRSIAGLHGYATKYGLHQVARGHNFHRSDVDADTVTYDHRSGAYFHAHGDGSWTLVRPDKRVESGMGAESLDAAITRLKRGE